MTLVRVAAALAATLLGCVPLAARAIVPPAATQVVAAGRIAPLAERIARTLVPDPDRALVPAFVVADVVVPAGTVAVVPGTPQVNSTYISVPIAIDIDGALVRTVFTGFRITSYVRMPVAAHDLAGGTVLADDDLTYARVPFNGRPALDTQTLVGRRVRSIVARGEVVYPELTVVNEIVHAGMPALLIVHDGPVRLAADVVARTSGGLGDYVTIFDPQTQRALSGVVTAPNTVELTVPGANE